MRTVRAVAAATAGVAVLAGSWLIAAPAASAKTTSPLSSFIDHKHTRLVASTIPANGDINPYGVAVVRHTSGRLVRGNILVSNFNDKANQQGTGSTIVQISPRGKRTLFAHIRARHLPGRCTGGIGLSTALVTVHNWVIVGSVPSKNGQASTSSAGCLLVLDSTGRVRETFVGHGINGPWDMTAVAFRRTAVLFVANVLNGTRAAKGKTVFGGTILRLTIKFRSSGRPALLKVRKIGGGFPERTDPVTFVDGPTGVGLARNGELYIANTAANKINVIPNALTRMTSTGTGATLTMGAALKSPLGLAIAPNGNVLTVNGGNGLIVETTPAGKQIATKFLDTTGSPKGNGALFGLAVAPNGRGLYYVDDVANTLRILG